MNGAGPENRADVRRQPPAHLAVVGHLGEYLGFEGVMPSGGDEHRD